MSAIGGFLPLDPGPPLGCGGTESVAERWRAGAAAWHGFRNGRSALALGACAAFAPIRRLWMPAFACRALEEGAQAALQAGLAGECAVYPLRPDGPLEADPAFLARHVAPGDAVLVIAYFGAPPGPALRDLAARRPDVIWIEDRAQALWPGPAWGDALLYSPRKLLGVPDGGYLHLSPQGAARARTLQAEPPSPIPPSPWPALRRFEDESARAEWFPPYRAAEARARVGPGAPSRMTGALLARQDFGAIAACRRANHALLASLVPAHFQLLLALDGGVPLGLPLLLPDAAATAARMAEAAIFCPVLWPEPSDPGPCARARALAGRVLLLPVDQRYGPEEMERVASVFRSAAGSGSAAPRAASPP